MYVAISLTADAKLEGHAIQRIWELDNLTYVSMVVSFFDPASQHAIIAGIAQQIKMERIKVYRLW